MNIKSGETNKNIKGKLLKMLSPVFPDGQRFCALFKDIFVQANSDEFVRML